MVPPTASNAVSSASSRGVLSALDLARRAGKNPDEAQVKAFHLAYPKPQATLLEVQQAARQLGVETEGMKATLAELEARRQPFIAALRDRFLFVDRVEGDWVRFAEGGALRLRPRAQFEQEYQGVALVLPEATTQNTLEISPSIIYWDKIPIGTAEKQVQVVLANRGTKPIRIESIKTSCSCTVPSQWPKEVLPGQEVPLSITIQLSGSGEVAQSVSIVSDGTYPYGTVSLQGRMEHDVRFDPSQINWGEVLAGQAATRKLLLRDPERKLARPLRASTTSAQFTAQVIPKEEDAFEIAVAFSAPAQPGEVEAKLLISGPQDGGRVISVPLEAYVVPMLRVQPERVVFGSVGSEGGTKTVRVFRQDQRPFEVAQVMVPGYLVAQASPSNAKRSEWRLKVTILPQKSPAQVADKIALQIKNGNSTEALSLPVLALVESEPTTEPNAQAAALLPRAEDDADSAIGQALPLVAVGAEAPDSRFVDADGNPWHLKALRGQKNVLLTFFPKCFTGGCATHLASLRDLQKELDATDTQVIAVSVDAAEGARGQKAFAKEWRLQFPLIPDTQRDLSKLYGAVQRDGERASRLSFLIDKKGIVRWVDTQVQVATHGADALRQIQLLRATR